MGSIARVLSFERVIRSGVEVSIVKINPDGGANITGVHFADTGDDAHPLPSDYVATSSIRGAGQEAVVGYADPLNEGKSEPGEKRIYGRDSSGAFVNEVWLKADGSILIENAGASILVKPSGEVNIISPDIKLGDLVAIELVTKDFLFNIFNNHVHGASPLPTPLATVADHTLKTKGS